MQYGHTVNHAVELTYGISHGCAVAVGMLAASFISRSLGIMTTQQRGKHDTLVRLLGVPLPAPPSDDLRDQDWTRVCGDNKRGYIPLRFVAVFVAFESFSDNDSFSFLQ